MNNFNDDIKNMFSNYDDYKNIISILNRFTNMIIEELSPKLSLELSSNLNTSSKYLSVIIDRLIEENKQLKNKLDESNNLLNEVSNNFFGFFILKRIKAKIIKSSNKKGVTDEKNK